MNTGPESPRDDSFRPVQIGPYRILDVLGEGGMGTVYLAEQQEPVTRRVALKVIKLGMDSKAVVARFEQERQTLALMQHDGIARVYDCGTTETGQPFFVMELVQGKPLTTFCDEARLTLAQRLNLLQQVCSAVQHAHQKGVVHRDLKPGNVLVTDRDGKLQAKVIDFGLAKAMGSKLVEATLFTEIGQIVGTPEYMAPEQADPTNLDIDTRADVYSLGVILYELLVGRVPFPWRELRQAGLQEMQRILREVEPPRPSTRLLTTAGASAVAAEARRMSPSALRRALEQDLDWVVLKALDKDRNRRYETPAGLASDLQRFLDDQPVEAGPPSLGYRLRKFVRRHRARLMVTAVVAVTAIVSAFLVIREQWRTERAMAATRTRAAAETNFLLAEESVRRGAWQQALAAYEQAAQLGYPDRFAIELGKVQALDGIEPTDARDQLAKLDENGLGPARQAKLLLLRGSIGTDWAKTPQTGVAALRAARQLQALAPADDLFAQALLETDLRAAWRLLRAALVIAPGHTGALRTALPISVFVGTSRDMVALVHEYSGVCPGDKRLPILRAMAMMMQEEPLDAAEIETELRRIDNDELGSQFVPILRFLADRRQHGVQTGQESNFDIVRKALPLILGTMKNPASGDWVYVLHPSLLKYGPSLIKLMSGLTLGMSVSRQLDDLEVCLPDDRLWDVIRTREHLRRNDLDAAWQAWNGGRSHSSFITRFVGRQLWEQTLMRVEQGLLVSLQYRQAEGKGPMSADQSAAMVSWAVRVIDGALPPSDLENVVKIALAIHDSRLAIEASLRLVRVLPEKATSAKYWLAYALTQEGAVQWARRLVAELLAEEPTSTLLQTDLSHLESRLRHEVAYPLLAARLRAELEQPSPQPEATEALTTARRALLWVLTQWELEEPGKGHGDQATALRQELGLQPH